MRKFAGIVSALLAGSLVLAGCSFGGGKSGSSATATKAKSANSASYDSDIRVLNLPGDHKLLSLTGYSSPDRRVVESSSSEVDGIVDPPAGEGYSRFYAQSLDWQAGDKGRETAKVYAPLDWANPGGKAVTLHLARIVSKAGSDAPSLFVNPGGPGGSGIDYLASFEDSPLLEKYSIVAWDPRGAGTSTPVVCGNGKQTDAYYSTDFSPDTQDEWQKLVDASKQYADLCRKNSGDLLDHVSTIETIQDLDMLRNLVGNEQLNFLGVSYGTDLGSMYAEFFPDRVGKMVLDSAVNITGDESIVQAMGFELALDNWAAWCAKTSSCSFGTDKAQVLSKVDKFLRGLDSAPLKVGDRVLTQSMATAGLALMLYSDASYYPMIYQALKPAVESGEGNYLLMLADTMYERNSSGEYGGIYYSFNAIRCVDGADKGLSGAKESWQYAISKAPVYGFNTGIDLVCEYWTAKPVPQIKRVAKGAAPIVVIGTTGDSATPYKQAKDMAAQLESGVLVTLDGAGHGAYSGGGSNPCVAEAVNKYLLEDVVPQNGMVCKA